MECGVVRDKLLPASARQLRVEREAIFAVLNEAHPAQLGRPSRMQFFPRRQDLRRICPPFTGARCRNADLPEPALKHVQRSETAYWIFQSMSSVQKSRFPERKQGGGMKSRMLRVVTRKVVRSPARVLQLSVPVSLVSIVLAVGASATT